MKRNPEVKMNNCIEHIMRENGETQWRERKEHEESGLTILIQDNIEQLNKTAVGSI